MDNMTFNNKLSKFIKDTQRHSKLSVFSSALALLLFMALALVLPLQSKLSYFFKKTFIHAATLNPNDWPQIQKDPQHTGFTSETIGTNFQVKWTHAFQPEKVYPQVQPIVYQGNVYIGTENGHLYALNSTTGAAVWTFPQTGNIGPIQGSVVAGNGLIFLASLDGSVYAIDAVTGSQVWKNQLSSRTGFSASPILDDSANPTQVLVGNRDGTFYSLDPSSGATKWSFKANSPILMTAAYDNGKVFFATMDIHMFALNTTNGSQVWKSPQLSGIAFNDYWPVITKGKVVIRSTSASMKSPDGIPVNDYSDTTQTNALAAYDSNPSNYSLTLHVLDENTGAELPGVIQWDYMITLNGGPPPVCVDKDGYIITPAQKSNIYPNSWESGWARVSLTTRKIIAGLTDTSNLESGYGNNDENMSPSCTANGVVVMHIEEGNAQYTGFYNLLNNTWTRINSGVSNNQLTTNTQGGGSNPVSISNGWMYHIAWGVNLVARSTN